MADTGLPWELPYPLPTDLVRDGADAIKDLAEATATGLSAAGNAGIGSNVVQATKTNTFTTSSTSDVLITDLEATITPTSDTSKVLVIATIRHSSTASDAITSLSIYRGESRIGAGGSSASAGSRRASDTVVNDSTIVFLDSPGVDSATTYSARVRTSGSTAVINRWGFSDAVIGLCSITVIEVEA